MYHLERDLIFVILQFLLENNFHESAQKLEQESKVYFNLTRFTSLVLSAQWADAEVYLQSFTSPNDNENSMMMFWMIGKQRYLEALDEHNLSKAIAIFENDLKPLWNGDTYRTEVLAKLLALKNFRESPGFAKFGDIPNMRAKLVMNLKTLLKTNWMFHQKFNFPKIKSARLNKLMAQSGEWQHFLCGNDVKRPTTSSSTLYADHKCELPSSSTPHHHLNLHLQQRVLGPNAGDNGAGPSSAPLGTMNLIDLFQK